MSNNRTEQQALITSLFPTVDLSELQAALIQSGYVFKKDVTGEVTAAGGTALADFSAQDQVIVTTAGNVNITVTGLEDGQRAKLVVNKNAADTVSFTGIAGTLDGELNGQTVLYYDVLNVNSFIVLYQKNGRQRSGSIAEVDITEIAGNEIISVDHFKYQINNNMIFINGELDINVNASTSQMGFNITGRQFGTFEQQSPNRYEANIRVFNQITSQYITGIGYVFDNSGTYQFRFKQIPDPTTIFAQDQYVFYFSLSAKIR